ncbi:hypothetical protein CBW16_10055 [Flavobacteriaceae bacterium JJC]|nr:hypothetical protein CBW16_10055 [Flavobacteriaceae bacterium JJC]
MKKVLLFVMIFIMINILSQQKATLTYKLYSTIGQNGVSDISPGGAIITYDFEVMQIIVQKRNGKTDTYKILSSVRQGVTPKGEEYSQVLTSKGKEIYDFRLLSNRVLIVHKATRTGIAYYL